jgi:hypothetical protein
MAPLQQGKSAGAMRLRARSITRAGAACLAIGSLAQAAAAAEAAQRAVVQAPFGQIGDQAVEIYTLTNAHRIEVRIMTYGATIVSLNRPAPARCSTIELDYAWKRSISRIRRTNQRFPPPSCARARSTARRLFWRFAC